MENKQTRIFLFFRRQCIGEVEGAYWFGPVLLNFWPSVCPSLWTKYLKNPWTRSWFFAACGNSRTAYARILKFYMWALYMKNKQTRIFSFFRRSCISRVMPLFQLSLWNLVNKISQEPLMLGSWFFAGRIAQGVDDLINFWKNSWIFDRVMPLFRLSAL